MEPLDFIHKEDGGIDYEATLMQVMNEVNSLKAFNVMLTEKNRRACHLLGEAGIQMEVD